MHTCKEKNGIRVFMGGYSRRRWHCNIEFYWWHKSCACTVEIENDEHNLQLHLALPPFNLFVSLASPLLSRFAKWALRGSYEGRQTGLKIHDWTLWWECWANSDCWSSRDPKWMRWTWHPLDTFFGRTNHTEREVAKMETLVQMPEKAYPCTVVMKDEAWKRPRLPWASHRTTRAHIDIPGGIPFPGKGENSWDCGEDATYGMTCPARTVEEGVAKVTASVLRDRTRYGGPAWRPTAAGTP